MVDGSGTIDPANLSNSGMFRASLFFGRISLLFPFCLRFVGLCSYLPGDLSTCDPARSGPLWPVGDLLSFIICYFLFPVTFQTDAPPSLCYAGTIPC